MSNPDSFIDEVNEELKRDRLFALMRKYGWITVVAVIAVVGYASWNEWSKARDEARARAFGDSVVSAIDQTDQAGRVAALAAIAAQQAADGASQGRAGIVNLLLAAETLESGDRAGALAALEAVATNAGLPQSYRQLATLKRVIIAGADLPVAEREQLLAGLAAPGQVYRPLALEQLALLRFEAGDRAAALRQFRALLDEPELTAGLRQRVQTMIVILGGDASELG